MAKIQSLFDENVKKNFLRGICNKAVRRALCRHGLKDDEELLEQLASHLYLALFEDGPSELKILDGQDVEVSMLEEDFCSDDIDALEFSIREKIESFDLLALSEALADNLLVSSDERTKEVLTGREAAFDGLRQAISLEWGKGLGLLEIMLDVCLSTGNDFSSDYLELLGNEQENNELKKKLAIVLRGLHVKACRTASEILCLLKNGYADGANSRWRTLHEVAVTAIFISHHKGDLPERYLRHAHIQRRRAALSYQEHCSLLGYEPLDNEELQQHEDNLAREVGRYGRTFKGDCGWAASILEQPSFTKIERSLDLSKWRPYYQMACKSVHAGSDGLFWTLGLDGRESRSLLAGASDYGLADPAQLTALSLVQVTSALWVPFMNLDGLVSYEVLSRLHEQCTAALMASNERMKSRKPL